jgi:hypothetical protein
MSGRYRWLPLLGRAATAVAALLALAGTGRAQDLPQDSPAAVRQEVMGIISYTRWPIGPPQRRRYRYRKIAFTENPNKSGHLFITPPVPGRKCRVRSPGCRHRIR